MKNETEAKMKVASDKVTAMSTVFESLPVHCVQVAVVIISAEDDIKNYVCDQLLLA